MLPDEIKEKIEGTFKEQEPECPIVEIEEQLSSSYLMRLEAIKLAFDVAHNMDELKDWARLEDDKRAQRMEDIMQLRDMIYDYLEKGKQC